MFRIFFILATLIITAGSCSSPDYLRVDDLVCENLVNPLGIDTTVPHFSWKLFSERDGTKQKAYRILVSTDSLLLAEGKADLWNSGKVKSPASVMVPYSGKELSRDLSQWRKSRA